jgi:hypothetical protein
MKRKDLKPRKDPDDSCPFPLEAMFPGIHKLRPDIAAAEAEQFLAHGSGPTGFPLDADAVRDITAPGEFTDFRVNPLPPEWQAIVDAVPDWTHPQAEEAGRLLLADLRRRVPALRPDLIVELQEENEVWICAVPPPFLSGRKG